MTNRGGRPKLHGIDEYFRPASEEGFTLNRVVCKLCSKTMAKHTSKQLRHLHTQCTAYRQLHEVIPSRQPLINTKLDSVSKASKDALDRQAAVAVFTSGKPYSLYEEPETLKLFQMLNSAYKPPDRNRVASFLDPQECYGQRKAFITAAITRWGTQLAAVKSVFDNKDALRAFARDSVILNGMKQVIVKEEEQVTQPSLPQVISYINDLEFWANLEMLFKVLQPIGHAQAAKPTQNATGRDLGRSFHQRFEVQTDDIHYMAFALDPATTDPKHHLLTTDIVRRAHNFLEDNTNAEEYGNIFREFCQFRAREGNLFGPGSRIYRAASEGTPHYQHVLDSWRYLHSMNVSLAALAKRVLGALANSVPSERSFSSINFLHNKIRNRLTVTSTNKLTFIYMNSRVLRRLETAQETPWRIPGGQSWETADVKLLLELEDDFQDCIFVHAGTDAETESVY
ncbi:Ribonuclease H-like superfamily [Fusarium oxysporum f. sp. vasinfectum]|nr:Ribonuclease H-like superfamily [Fusarium oxysporum f. sp. vasinfectum]